MSKWTRFRDTVTSRVKDEFKTIKDAEVHRLKQKSTYAGIAGIVGSVTAASQLSTADQWMALISAAVSLYLIYVQKKQS